MSMIEWAKKEIEIALDEKFKELEERFDDDYEFDYVYDCCHSALKAYLSLMEDDHSELTFRFTRQILNRLMGELPLTPIEDIPENWQLISNNEYQCKRMCSLFKKVDHEGNVKYTDDNRYYCKNIKTGDTFICNKVSEYLNDHYPITMPYYPPTRKIIVNCEEHDDDIKMINILFPDGEKVEVETEDN